MFHVTLQEIPLDCDSLRKQLSAISPDTWVQLFWGLRA